MLLSSFIEGLKILQPYYKSGDGYHIGAEHDQFFAYATDLPLSDVDADTMFVLGWFQPNTQDEYIYDPEDGWSCFT